jgi:hypothetical protein
MELDGSAMQVQKHAESEEHYECQDGNAERDPSHLALLYEEEMGNGYADEASATCVTPVSGNVT